MKCIFCKKNSDSSTSVEHMIPECLGNFASILPKGAVCDKCNNYFAIKVEKIVLDSDEIARLRFSQMVENKKGRVPAIEIVIDGTVVTANRTGYLDFTFSDEGYHKLQESLNSKKGGTMYIPISGAPPPDHFMARFLAKMALESLVIRWSGVEDWNGYLVNNNDLDDIRNFARFPKKGQTWPFSKRRIYDVNYIRKDTDGKEYQIMNEWDILATGGIDNSEYYFVIAIFGMEYAINLGGDSMDGYYHWLNEHNQISPLYHGKNA